MLLSAMNLVQKVISTVIDKVQQAKLSGLSYFDNQYENRTLDKLAVEHFEILLDNPKGTFSAGSVVTGIISVEVNRPLTTKDIKVKLIGDARAKCPPTPMSLLYPSDTVQHLVYIINNLLSSKDGTKQSQKSVLETGVRQEFPFHFRLANSLPASFTHPLGIINYRIEAVILNQHSETLRITSTPICLNANVNLRPETMLPYTTTGASKRAHCCDIGPVSFQLSVPKTGFLPGESIPVRVCLSNKTSRTVQSISLAVIQIAQFFKPSIKYDRLTACKTICEIKGPDLNPGEVKVWNSNLKLHRIPPTGLGGCRIINIQYVIKIVICQHYGPYVVGTIPICIGTCKPNANPSTCENQRSVRGKVKCVTWATD